MKKYILITSLLLSTIKLTFAQDTVKQQHFNLYFQQMIVTQYKPAFSAAYSGANSLLTGSETQSSITTTLFGGAEVMEGGRSILILNYPAVQD